MVFLCMMAIAYAINVGDTFTQEQLDAVDIMGLDDQTVLQRHYYGYMNLTVKIHPLLPEVLVGRRFVFSVLDIRPRLIIDDQTNQTTDYEYVVFRHYFKVDYYKKWVDRCMAMINPLTGLPYTYAECKTIEIRPYIIDRRDSRIDDIKRKIVTYQSQDVSIFDDFDLD